MMNKLLETKFARDIKGATLVYVSLMMALLIGMAGIAIDMSRLATAHTQAQAAVDAAALAAAAQLDGSLLSIERATEAAANAALVVNSQKFSDEDNTAPNVQVSLRFMSDLPASDDDPITSYTTNPRQAFFVEATSETFTHDNLLLPALGVAMSKRYNATAVAGQDASICRLTQFAICNPGETAGTTGNQGFDYTDWVGKLIRVRSGGGNAWAPGNFGYLDPPNGGTGAPAIAEFLAQVDANDQCYSIGLNTRTGYVASTRNAVNTRFDIYENPFFSPGGGPNDPRTLYPPAQNVTKGWVPSPGMGMSPSDPCVAEPDTSGATMGFPIDNDQVIDDNDPFGNGDWDCLDYWNINHPDDPNAVSLLADHGITCVNDSDLVSRYEMYRWEIENNKIPGAATGLTAEEGYPQCSSNAPAQNAPYDINTDRRVLNFAVMNCIAEGVQGNTDGVPAIAYVRAFLTQPIATANTYDVYLEVIDVDVAGSNTGPLNEYVEIYR